MLFVISGLDHQDGLEHRLAVRPRHREHVASLGEDLILAGPYLDAAGEPIGSMIILRAESLEAAQRFADADPFVTDKVFASVTVTRWDWLMNRPGDLVT